MTSSMLTEKLKDAIRAQDREAVDRLLAKARTAGGILREAPQPVALAVATQNEDLIQAVARFFSGPALAPSCARAMEEGQEEVVRLLLNIGQSKPMDGRLFPRAILKAAAREGWLRPLNKLLPDHPDLFLDTTLGDWKESPLSEAIIANQPEVFKRILRENIGPNVRFGAALDAAKEGRPHLLPLLWDQLASAHQGAVLAQAVTKNWTVAIDWFMAHLTPDTLRAQWTKDPDTRNRTLVAAAEQGRADVVRLLLPIMDPSENKSAALKVAVENKQDEVIGLLLPRSDPKQVRKVWLAQSPPQWPLVDYLGVHLPTEQQATWCSRPDKMPQTVAHRRAREMNEQAPAAPARRHPRHRA